MRLLGYLNQLTRTRSTHKMRSKTFGMNAAFFRIAVLVLLTGCFATGLAFTALRAARPAGGVEIILPTASPESIVVYVTGAVQREGVYTLRSETRVSDAVAVAGGFTENADRARVNLAARLADESHIDVPQMSSPAAPATASGASGGVAQPLNINTATSEQLTSLPGIGSVRAEAIVSYRTAHGPFKRVEDLLLVEGIGSGTLSSLRALVIVR